MRSLLLSLLVFFSSVSLSMAPKLNWDKAIDKAVYRYGLKTEPDLMRSFAQAKVAYPPKKWRFWHLKRKAS